MHAETLVGVSGLLRATSCFVVCTVPAWQPVVARATATKVHKFTMWLETVMHGADRRSMHSTVHWGCVRHHFHRFWAGVAHTIPLLVTKY
jgi:hypothetical protein